MTDFTVTRNNTTVSLGLQGQGQDLLVARDVGKENARIYNVGGKNSSRNDSRFADDISSGDRILVDSVATGSTAFSDVKNLSEKIVKPHLPINETINLDLSNVPELAEFEVGFPDSGAVQLSYNPGETDMVGVQIQAAVVNRIVVPPVPWHSWMKDDQATGVAGTSLPTATPSAEWTVSNVGAEANFVAGQESVYVVSSDTVYSLDLDDGTVNWSKTHGSTHENPPNEGVHYNTANNQLYISYHHDFINNNGQLAALDASDGSVDWTFDPGTNSEGTSLFPENIASNDSSVFVHTWSLASNDPQVLYSLDQADGSVNWSVEEDPNDFANQPVLTDTFVIWGGGNALLKEDLNGNRLASYNGSDFNGGVGRGGYVLYEPSLFVTEAQTKSFAHIIDVTDMTHVKRNQFDLGTQPLPPVSDGDSVWVREEGGRRVKFDSGLNELTNVSDGGSLIGQAAISNDGVVLSSMGFSEDRIAAYNPDTLTEIWNASTDSFHGAFENGGIYATGPGVDEVSFYR